jgi:cellulose synthase/poly-beta-1,6-N-acetylglucosamine synthase-like glycosyltransferase
VCPIRFGLAFRGDLIERGGPLNWSTWVRQTHRWLSIAFMVTVIVNFVVLGQEEAVRKTVAYLPLLPLALLLFTGLYLFVLPYAAKWRSGRRTD